MELNYALTLLRYKDRVLYLVYRKVFGKAYRSHYVNTIMRLARNPIANVSTVISSISFSLSDVPGTTAATISRVIHLFLEYIQNLHEGKLSDSALKDISVFSNQLQTLKSTSNPDIIVIEKSKSAAKHVTFDVSDSVCQTIDPHDTIETPEIVLPLGNDDQIPMVQELSSVDSSTDSSLGATKKKKKKKKTLSEFVDDTVADKPNRGLASNPEPVQVCTETVEPKVVEVVNEKTVLSRTSSKRRNTKELTLSSSSSGVLDLSPTGNGQKVKISNSQDVKKTPSASTDFVGSGNSDVSPVLSPAELLFIQLVGETMLTSTLGGRLRARYLDRAKQFGLTERLGIDNVPEIFNKLRISYENLSMMYASSEVFEQCQK